MHILKFKIFFGKDLQAGGFIEAGDDIFLNEIIEYDITNEEPARFKNIKIIIQIIYKIRFQLISPR